MEAAPQEKGSTRTRILDAALEILAEDGIAKLTNRSLAGRAGVSLGTLTYHFSSQDEVLRDALARFVEGEATRLEAIAESASDGDDPAVGLAAVQELLSGDSARRLAKLELYVAAARSPEIMPAARRCFEAYDAVVARGLESVGVEATELNVRAVVAMIDGLQLRRLSLGESGELAVVDSIGLLLRGATRDAN